MGNRKWRLFAWQRLLQMVFEDTPTLCCMEHQIEHARADVKLAEYIIRRVERQYHEAERDSALDDRIA